MSPNSEQQDSKTTNWVLISAVMLIAFLGSFIGLEMIVTFGLSPYTAIIGIICAMLFARVPLSRFKQFRSTHIQNLMQTSVTCATFGAANALLVPIGIPFLLGREDLILPMLLGASLAMFVDTLMIYHFFGTPLFPADESWPKGLATAKTIMVGIEGGKPLLLLGLGLMSGWLGALFHLPLSALGMAFLSQLFPMIMLGVGNIIGDFSKELWQIDLHSHYFPHAVMIGAGMVILFDSLKLFISKKRPMLKERAQESNIFSISIKYMFLFFVLSMVMLWISGLFPSMTLQQIFLFSLLTTSMQFFQRMIVGSTVMQTGFIPAFSLALVFLVMGIILGLPIDVLCIFAGFTAGTGPVFACMGEALKTGYVLRSEGKQIEFKDKGKKQQLYVVWLTLLLVVLIVFFSYPSYFAQNRVPPIDHVYFATLNASASIEIMSPWLIGAVFLGMVLQWTKGAGILFATGLLLNDSFLGGMILFGVILKLCVGKRIDHSIITILAAGFISGDVMGRLSSTFVMDMKAKTE